MNMLLCFTTLCLALTNFCFDSFVFVSFSWYVRKAGDPWRQNISKWYWRICCSETKRLKDVSQRRFLELYINQFFLLVAVHNTSPVSDNEYHVLDISTSVKWEIWELSQLENNKRSSQKCFAKCINRIRNPNPVRPNRLFISSCRISRFTSSE